ncbi:phosphatase PAP2 family protein [Agaribacter flavus]|uniref:undecaprenyl-diphosphate phosphatase n=1 Tax=Agaribacter flavus TaxID=1902781 RepID=A0ABV7FS06_9ALTE
MKRLASLDQQVFEWIANQTSSQERRIVMPIFKWVSKTGDGHLYFVLAGILYYLDKQHGALFFYTALLAYSFEIPMYIILKRLFKRARPCDLLRDFHAIVIPADKFSLPSGHTAAAFLMATIIAHFYPSVGVLVYTWASLVGISRVVLRVHFPLDTIIGAALGSAVALVSINILG